MAARMSVGLLPALSRFTIPRTPIRPQFFPSRPFSTPLSPFRSFPKPTTNLSSTPRPPRTASSTLLSRLLPVLRRTFTSSQSHAIRQTYFPGGSGSGGGGRGGPGWFQRLRYNLDSRPPMHIIYALLGLNVGVYLLWQYAIQSWTRFRDPWLYSLMLKNFVLNETNVMAGRIWTLITCCFSHSSGGHILINAIGLYFIAPASLGLIGASSFLGLYLGGGIAASVTSLLWHRMRGERFTGSEGASGAIYATLAFYGAMFPRSTILLFFVLPMPSWVAISGFFAWDMYQAVAYPNSGIDSAGHIGGLVAGLLIAARFRRFSGFRRPW